MRRSMTVLLTASLLLSACGGWRDSRVNPSNWFGRQESVPINVDTEGDVNPLLVQGEETTGLFDRPEPVDASVPITKVTELKVEPTNTGAIILVTGVANRQGAYRAELRRQRTEENQKNGVLAFTFRVVYPEYSTPQGSERARKVSDAVSVTNQTLEGIRLVRVIAETNALESRRR